MKKDHTLFGREIDVLRIDNDSNGNPRYVIHFLCVASEYERAMGQGDAFGAYERTLRFLQGSGWKRYHNKKYGGGLMTSSYSLDDDLRKLEEFTRAAIADEQLYIVTEEQLAKFSQVRDFVHMADIVPVSHGSQLRIKFKCREIEIDTRISWDHNRNCGDNYYIAAVVAARLASRKDAMYDYEVTPQYTETRDGYSYAIKAVYVGEA